MSLLNQINQDFVSAYKAREEERVSVLRLLKSALKNAEIEKKAELNDDDVIKVIRKEIKQRQEAAAEYRKGERVELASKEENEAKTLSNYLPAEMGETELSNLVEKTIQELNASNPSQTGMVIGAVMKKVGSQADGSRVSAIVRELLNKH